MIYFLNDYLVAMNSGIEHSELQRLQALRHAGVPATLITRSYNRLQAQNLQRFGIPADWVLNMYDYFQQATAVPLPAPNEPQIDQLQLEPRLNVTPGRNQSHVYDGDRLAMTIHFVPGSMGQVYAIDYFDKFSKRVAADLYDFRGFKSRSQLFDTDGQLLNTVSYTPDGTPVIEETFVTSATGQSELQLFKLIGYHSRDHYFDRYDQVFTFFLEELNQQSSDAVFVADRPGTPYQAMLAMSGQPARYVTLPTAHTIDPQDQVFGNLMGMYADPLINQIKRLRGIIVATDQQKVDLTRWMGGLDRMAVPINALPFAAVMNHQLEQPAVSLDQRIPGKVIFVGRLTENQQLTDLLTAFGIVYAGHAQATLDIYGYGDETAHLQEQIDQQGMTGVVTLKGYRADLQAAYDTACVFMSTTRSDSQPLAMVEAISHGVPVVTYQFPYGPAEMIRDGRDGYLVSPGDTGAMARYVSMILRNGDLWSKLSMGAYAAATMYAESSVAQAWRTRLTHESGTSEEELP